MTWHRKCRDFPAVRALVIRACGAVTLAARRSGNLRSMSDVSRILTALERGDLSEADRLLPLVYDELRCLAARHLAREAPGQTLQPTALVHEAYLRLVASGDASAPRGRRWQGRGHFFAAAAEAMRRILVENARRKKALKRGGHRDRQEIDPNTVAAPEVSEDVLALDEALGKLAAAEPQVAELVRLRYFAGLTVKEAAEVLDVAPRTADAWWAYARAWLLTELRGGEAEGAGPLL
jgi:RNA polymerase sigma factor (TIGR02999 family)